MAPVDDPASVLLAYTQDKVAVIDEDGIFQYVNDAVDRLLGYDPEELIGDSAFEYIHPDDRGAARSIYEDVIGAETTRTETVRYRFQAADGEWIWFESRFSNVTDEALGGYVISSRDVTAEVVAQRERATAQDRLVETTRTVGDVVWMFTPDFDEVLFVNPAYEEVYGGSVEELQSDPSSFLDRIHPADRSCVEAAIERLSDGEPVDIEYRVNPDRDFDTFVWVQAQPIVESGDVARIVGFTRDITDRKRRERQLLVMDNLLRHNLRNDLSIVLGNADLIATEASAPHDERAEIIRQEGTDLLETAEKQRSIIDLLTDRQQPERIDVAELLSAAVDLAEDSHPDVDLTVDRPDGLAIQALPEVGAAIVEVIDNAVVHHPEGAPEVTITVTESPQWVHLEVADTCPRIPEEEYRPLLGDQDMDALYHSTGLGLWLVYWAVDLSEGLLSFEYDEETGNVITLSLPRADEDA